MNRVFIPALLAVLPSLGVMAAGQLTVTAVNKLQIARASQTIELTVSAAPRNHLWTIPSINRNPK